MTPLNQNSPIFPPNLRRSEEKSTDLFALPKVLELGKKPRGDVGAFLLEVALPPDERLVNVLKRIPIDHPLHNSLKELTLYVALKALIEAIEKAPPLGSPG